jgi:hypothetical protein
MADSPSKNPHEVRHDAEAEAPTEGRSLALGEIGRLVAGLRELEARATPGPWVRDTSEGTMGIQPFTVERDARGITKGPIVGGCGCCGSPFGRYDEEEAAVNAKLIVALRNNARTLFDKLESLLGVAESARDQRYAIQARADEAEAWKNLPKQLEELK